jgi:hypothetical protein
MERKKTVKVIRYDTLTDCFQAFIGFDCSVEEEARNHYWCGHNGIHPYRVNVWRWLNTYKHLSWGWAEYKTKTIHMWMADDCPVAEMVRLFAHEVAHLRLPRPYKDDRAEELKARRSEYDASFAYTAALAIGENKK